MREVYLRPLQAICTTIAFRPLIFEGGEEDSLQDHCTHNSRPLGKSAKGPTHTRKRKTVMNMVTSRVTSRQVSRPVRFRNFQLSNFLAGLGVFDALLAQDFGLGLVGELQIFLERDSVFDGHEHDGQGDEQTASQKRPRRRELADVGDRQAVEAPNDGGTSGLDALVEAGVVC
jgi:hypothetical protein